jgi:SAM-dependent methyltransferase
MSIDNLTTEERLTRLLNHLGIMRTHMALGPFSEQAIDFAVFEPERIASLTFILSPRRLGRAALADGVPVLCIAGQPMQPAMIRNLEAINAISGSMVVELPGSYDAQPWSDVVRDHTDLIVASLLKRTQSADIPPVNLKEGSGTVEGVSYHIEGAGPPLLLFPINIAPTQWDAAIPRLKEHFTCIRLGGAHIGFVNQMEERAGSGGTYLQAIRTLFDLMRIAPGDKVLEVGTGTGALARDLGHRINAPAEIVATDLNEFLLGEARVLAASSAPLIDFRNANAEALPFEDGTFDSAFAITVFEECDVERGIAELHRVLKRGGTAAVVVRSRDLPQYWNVSVNDGIRQKLNRPQPQFVSPAGCVDSSLYERFASRFASTTPSPFWACFTFPTIEFFIPPVMALLQPDEVDELQEAFHLGRASGTAFAAIPFHAVVGTKA